MSRAPRGDSTRHVDRNSFPAPLMRSFPYPRAIHTVQGPAQFSRPSVTTNTHQIKVEVIFFKGGRNSREYDNLVLVGVFLES
jgi:hypothetical protein